MTSIFVTALERFGLGSPRLRLVLAGLPTISVLVAEAVARYFEHRNT
jgi:hypothetical protein